MTVLALPLATQVLTAGWSARRTTAESLGPHSPETHSSQLHVRPSRRQWPAGDRPPCAPALIGASMAARRIGAARMNRAR